MSQIDTAQINRIPDDLFLDIPIEATDISKFTKSI